MKDKYGRPDWDSFYIAMCFLIARRSIDQHTKHGCIIVDKNNKILSTGYNGPPGGLDDSKLDLTRPGKYKLLEHSELNAILNSKGANLEGSTFYITGYPCHTCFRQMRIVKAKKIVHGGQGSHCLSDEDSKAIGVLNSGPNPIEVVHLHANDETILSLYADTLDAYKSVIDKRASE